MTQASILLQIAVLTIVLVESMNGFILNNVLPETTTEEMLISTTMLFSEDAVITKQPFYDIHRNFSEDHEKNSKQLIANSSKDIVTIEVDTKTKGDEENHVPDESDIVKSKLANDVVKVEIGENTTSNQTNQQIPEESKKVDSELITVTESNGKVDDLAVKLPEESIAKDINPDFHKNSLPIETEFIVKSKNNTTEITQSGNTMQPLIETENKFNETKNQLNKDDQNILLPTTTQVLTGNRRNDVSSTAPNKDTLDSTTIADIEIETLPNIERTNLVETYERTTSMPVRQIPQNLKKLQDLDLFFEGGPNPTRKMRNFNFGADNNDLPDKNVTAETVLNSGKTNQTFSKSIDSSFGLSSMQEENNAGGDSSNKKDVSTENVFEMKMSHEKTDLSGFVSKVSPTLFQPNSTPTSLRETNPVPQEQIESDTDTLVSVKEIETTTKSVADVFSAVTNTSTDGKHIIFRKPGVEEELFSSNITNIDESIQDSQNEIHEEELGFLPTPSSVENYTKGKTITEVVEFVPEIEDILPTHTPSQVANKPQENMSQTVLPGIGYSNNSSLDTDTTHVLPEIEITTLTDKPIEIDNSDNDIDDKDSAVHMNMQPVSKAHHSYSSNLKTSGSISLSPSLELYKENPIQTNSSNSISVLEDEPQTSTEAPIIIEKITKNQTSLETFTNEIYEQAEIPTQGKQEVEDILLENSSEKLNVPSNDIPDNRLHDINNNKEREYTHHADTLQTMRDESSSVTDEVISPAPVARSFNAMVAEGLGKPLPTRSVSEEPSSSSYLSEDKTTTVLVLCSAAGGIFVAFSIAIYLITFQRQHGTLDIEMQEQECGKDDLDNDEDSETRVSLLHKQPTADSDEHSSD